MNSDSIKAKLKNIAVKEGKSFDYLLTLYLIERLLYRISISEYADKFVLKGGVLLYIVLEEKARATKDIDMLARQLNNSLENVEAIFKSVCEIKEDDAIEFDLNTLTVEKIKEDADYEGVRVKVTAFLDRTKKVLQMDIGFGDVIVPCATEMEYPSLLEMKKPLLKAYSMESVIAEKFEAMVYLAEANSRMKDFYDICILSQKYNFEGKVLKEAIQTTFKHRKTPLQLIPTIFTSDFRESKEKKQQWKAFKKRISSKEELEFFEVIDRLVKFLKPIYDSIIENKEFSLTWNLQEGRWK
ncbi:nucleotidyl transferase AbiEii/AbiGii toxin family protein [Clostridium thermarum]|uniref:nucleotidyl transferase AbiEii/AbiGii toxin family protein n=3 Tax=Clostridium thermarum TaxID=1716543 RepID=UPI0011213D4D|nr:nucleotidyl transferase AbiEii/AbiGii toxin family protein [Clostridium thermarum]